MTGKGRSIQKLAMSALLLIFAVLTVTFHERAIAQKTDGQAPADWVAEIEKIFIQVFNYFIEMVKPDAVCMIKCFDKLIG